MPRPRKTQISIEDTPWYRAVSRCVRKAWLTGVDPNTGNLLFKATELTQKFAKRELVEEGSLTPLRHSIAQYRSRLSDKAFKGVEMLK